MRLKKFAFAFSTQTFSGAYIISNIILQLSKKNIPYFVDLPNKVCIVIKHAHTQNKQTNKQTNKQNDQIKQNRVELKERIYWLYINFLSA